MHSRNIINCFVYKFVSLVNHLLNIYCSLHTQECFLLTRWSHAHVINGTTCFSLVTSSGSSHLYIHKRHRNCYLLPEI